MSAPDALVFPTDKSATDPVPGVDFALSGCPNALRGAVIVLGDGNVAPVACKASNRCAYCARTAAYVAMTMLRQDAQESDAPDHVLTLTSVQINTDSRDYRLWCAQFWRAFRKRYGDVEYCGFVEWTTGKAATSGGHRRLHSHWMVKSRGASFDVVEAQAWASGYWLRLSGAWRVELAPLRTVGGVVGYLALHHEKMEQAPPPGWRGRRLRPSQGYFARPGADRRARAEAWLRDHRSRRAWVASGNDPDQYDGFQLARASQPAPRLHWKRSEAEIAARSITDLPGSTLRRELYGRAREASDYAPRNVWARRGSLDLLDFLDIVERDHAGWRQRYLWACHFAARGSRLHFSG